MGLRLPYSLLSMQSHSLQSPRWMKTLTAVAGWMCLCLLTADAFGQTVIESGRESEILALFAPHALAAEVVENWQLRHVSIQTRTVDCQVVGPEGAQAVPTAPEASTTSASTVGLPRESSTSKALISTISAMSHLLSQFPAACGAGAACLFIVLTNIQGRQRFNQIVYGLHLREERLQG